MANKKINQLDVRTAVGTDLMLVGDPTSGIAFKSTLNDLPLVPTSRTLTINGVAFDLSANRAWTISSGITSVGLSMPSAFSVANSPITSSGTLAVTANGTAAQYIRGDGQLATLPSNSSGGSSVAYYLNGSVAASVGTYYQMSKIAVLGAGTDFSKAGNGLISQFLTDVADPNRLEIPAGNWNFEMYMSASSSGGTPAFYVELLKYNGTTFTSIASSSAIPEAITSGTIIDLYLTSLAIPQTTLLATDRLAIRVYIVNSTGGRTITMHTENSHLCEIITNFAGGIAALNGLTANTQYLATGTSGTDFAISSLTDTHTFNLPTASATNRGALSSADWSTFNGKYTLPSLTNGSVLFSNGTTIAQNNANFFWDDTNNRLGIGTATPNTTLDINGIINLRTAGLEFGRITTNNANANTGGVSFLYNSAGTFVEGWRLNGAGNFLLNTAGVDNSRFQVEGGARFTLGVNMATTSGSVGIGTASPQSRLEISEANRANSTNIANLGIYTSSILNTDVGGTIAFGGLFTGSALAPFASIRGGKENASSGNYAGYLAFQTIPNNGSLTERARITSAGRLLLGTTSESTFLLDVNGTARVSGDIRTQNGTTYTDLTADSTTGKILRAVIPAAFELHVYMNRTSIYGGSGVHLSSQSSAPTPITGYHDLNIRDLFSATVNSRDINISTYGSSSSDNKFLTFQSVDASNSDSAIRFRVTGWGNSAIMGISTRTGRNRNDFDFRIGYAAVDLNTGTLAYRINGDSGNFIIGSVGTNVASAILNVDSTTKGFLPPRMTTTQKNAIGTPAQGLMVFDTTLVKLCVYNGTAWETITSI
jgi:hypothetical protein